MASRFVDAGSVDDFISEQQNKSKAQKIQGDVKLLKLFLVNKNEERNIKDIPTEELNEYVYNFKSFGQNQRRERIRAVFSSKFTGKLRAKSKKNGDDEF